MTDFNFTKEQKDTKGWRNRTHLILRRGFQLVKLAERFFFVIFKSWMEEITMKENVLHISLCKSKALMLLF